MLVEVQGVDVVFEGADGARRQALSGVDFHVDAGECVAIIGHNGSGKSTLARLCNGLLLPSAGTVLVNGMDTADSGCLHDIHRVVGMVFQDPDAQMVATAVEDDVAFGLENYQVSQEEMRQRVETALRAVDMWDWRHKAPHQLSGGQKQRVAIAAVLAMQPQCVVFDEATSMLDAEGREKVMAAVTRLRQEGIAVVMVTHHMDEVLVADRIVVMHQGRVAADGTVRDLFGHADVGEGWRVEPPITIDVARRIGPRGWALPGVPITAAELAQGLRRAKPIPQSGASFARHRAERVGANADAAGDVGPRGAEPIIRMRDLRHTYMRHTPLAQASLCGVSVDIWPGEFVAVVGQTGSGKSTMVQHLNGLLRPQAGTVAVDGIDCGDKRADVRALRRQVGLAFQNPEDQLFEALVGDDVAFGPFQYGMPLLEVRERVRFALEAVGLSFDWRDRPIHGLSGGERRKVALAGVLAMGPKVLVLDEPTAGLDPQSRIELADRICQLQREHGVTVVWVTHQLEEVARYATRVLVLEAGLLVADGTPAALLADEDTLCRHHLRLPEAPRLAQDLRACGIPVPGHPLTREALVDAVQGVLEGREGGLAWRN